MSPGYVIVHGAGEGGFGRALGAMQQTREIENEAARREEEYRFNRKIAEKQLELAQKGDARADADMALNERQVASQEAFNQARTQGFQQEFELNAQQAEVQREMDKRRIAAIDKGLDEEQALAMFQSMEAAGIDLREDTAMREGIKAAGKVLGGGVGQALALMANATPGAQQVFQRLPAEYRGRYLSDMAEEHTQRRSDAEKEKGVGLADTLEAEGVLSPELGLQYREALAGATTPEEVRAALEPILGARRAFVTKQTQARRKGRLLASIEGQIVALAQTDAPDAVIETLEQLAEELRTDPAPEWEAYQERMGAMFGGQQRVPNVREDFPDQRMGGEPAAQPAQEREETVDVDETESSEPTEAEAEKILIGAGIDPKSDLSPEKVAEAERLLGETSERAREAAERYESRMTEEGAPTIAQIADEAGVPRRLVADIVNKRQSGLAQANAVKKYARAAIRQLRDFDSSATDAHVATELLRRKIAPTRDMADRVVAYLRSTGW